MDTESRIYRDLQEHLDRAPVGFPATESGADIRFLKHFFTPEEATIAIQLSTMRLEPIKRIYHRIKKSGISVSIEELQQILDRMVYKGTVLAYKEGYSETHYKNAGVSAGGMYDFQVDRLTKELVNDFQQYHRESFAMAETTGTVRVPQLRTIPVEKSVPVPEKFKTSTYDNVRHLIENAPGPLAVANCICRQDKDLAGKSCKYSDIRETCLQIGPDHARQYVDMGIARYISKEEAFDILDKAQEAGFILQPENSQRPEAICVCCGDCCGLLAEVLKSPRPADLYATNYYVEVNPELCKGCGVCVKRCQLEARAIVNGIATVNLDRCIGCGNCVITCESNASQLRKKEMELVPPKDKDATYMKIMSRKAGKWNTLKLRLKMLLGLRV
jgi:electron transport complex protein RnfB